MIPPIRAERSGIVQLCAVIVSLLWATPSLAFGPFPAGTTVFVDVANTSGNENGSAAHPFNTIQEGIDAAVSGAVVGVAAGTYNESISLANEISVVGVDPASVIIDAGDKGNDVVSIYNLTSVRLSGFTILGALPTEAGVMVTFPQSSILAKVLIDNNIITGNYTGIWVNHNYLLYEENVGRLVIDANLILQNSAYGIFRTGGATVTNNIIASNGQEGVEISGSSRIANNTIVDHDHAGLSFSDDDPAVITNNIISHNGGFGIDIVGSSNPNFVRPYVTYNLFFSNGAGNVSDIDPPQGNNATLNSAAQINSLSTNWANRVANPQFVVPGVDFHVTSQSPAIDAGTNLNAPKKDFDGKQRPVDGDGNCVLTTDIGAFEAPAPHRFVLCRVLFPEQWIVAGCEIIDCCPFCPGLLFDWIIRVDGDPLSELVLRFENLPPWEAEKLRIKGDAEWLDGGRLRIFGTGQTAIYGLPLSTNG